MDWLTEWLRLWHEGRVRKVNNNNKERKKKEGAGSSRSSWSRRATGSCKKLQLKISRRQAKKRRRSSRNRRGKKKKKPRSAANVNKKGSHSCQLFRVLFTNASRSACTTVRTAVKRPETAKKTDRQKYRAAFDRLQPHKNNLKQQQQQQWENIKPAGNINIGNILACCPKLSNYFDSWILTPIQPRAAADQVWAAGGGRGQRSHHKRAAWEYRTQRRLQLQLQLHSKHGAIVVVVVVLAVIDSRTSLPPTPCLLLLLLQLISSACAAVGCAFSCFCCRFAFFIRSLPNLSIN